MSLLVNANLGLRFLLELGVLAALAIWGFRTGGSTPAQLALGVAVALAVAILWATFIGPHAASAEVVKAVLQVAVFGGAALALAAAHSSIVVSAFIALVVVNAGLMAVLEN